ncbi:MAG TPA: excinuclease ABC subunit UvrA [Candidatus Methanoperedens sp.]|nr:excinuclease ABC subunit UvrA [Candidatus Methanoperedens sp.]
MTRPAGAAGAIVIRGAREHNLKNISLDLPRDRLVVITGVSGSGKSSLAFDTIYAEGQRRYVESLSAYARQFLELMEKPDVDVIEGLSPAISIEQRTLSRNPRSTVGTVTEIYDYLRLLYARVGRPACWKCGREITSQGAEQITDRVQALPAGTRVHVLAPLVRGRKGEGLKAIEEARRQGYVRVRVDGVLRDLGGEIALEKKKKHTIEVVVDRLVVAPAARARLAASIEAALALGDGLVVIEEVGARDHLFSSRLACPDCGVSYPELSPRLFSFNSPVGACPECGGLGTKMEFDDELVVPDPSLTLREGAILPWERRTSAYFLQTLGAVARHFGFDLETAFARLPARAREVLLHGSGDEEVVFTLERGAEDRFRFKRPFEGAVQNLERRYRETKSPAIREEIERYMAMRPCPSCKGRRLRPEALAVSFAGMNIAACTAHSVDAALAAFADVELTRTERTIADRVLKEIRERLQFLADVGLGYLTLDREAASLSGGEGQRIRLATQIGSRLVGVLYVLDEPSIGLHQRDNERLLGTLKGLRDLGNTVLVVEHDEATITAADHVVDLGPGAGEHGGHLVAAGTPAEILRHPDSLTGQYLSGRRAIPIPARRRAASRSLRLLGARGNNLKGIDLQVPLGTLTCVTGVSGSGKSTLVIETLFKALAHALYRAKDRPGPFERLQGLEHVDKVVDIDQSPIGRTPRSNPATYTGIFTPIRDLFAAVPEARLRGYRPGRFSFNVRGGRCEACEGDGIKRIEMHFLPDVYVTCDVCKGRRYNRETLEVEYRGRSIAQVLDLTVSQALGFFERHAPIRERLQTLNDVGLEYVKLGQSATTLSGGEAQRVKLSRELGRRSTGRTVYILDEPTTGLHFADIQKLLEVLNRLVDAGNTVVVIEHNLDVIKSADFVVDLGPEGGDAGGEIVAQGTPEQIARAKDSFTGRFLRATLGK